jgi:threonine dehydrogenase-like Zn-dependent dehydrogenase
MSANAWPYADMARSETGQSMGHEAIGVVEETGAEVRTVRPDDLIVMPFAFSDGTCATRVCIPRACTSGSLATTG